MVKTTSEDPTEKITKVTPLGEGSVDRKNAGLLMLAPRSGQSDSKKASKVSLAWKPRRKSEISRTMKARVGACGSPAQVLPYT